MNWFKKLISHYSEPEFKGEGRPGGPTQFGDRKIEEWGGEHREEIAKMAEFIKAFDWTGVERYKQELMEYYKAPFNQGIIDSIISSALGQSSKAIGRAGR